MITPNVNQSLSAIFDVELTTTDKSIDTLKIAAKTDSIDSLEAQRDYVRKNLIELIEQGKGALTEMTAIARSTESGKDYSAMTVIIKTLVDTNMTLLECEVAHKPKPEAVSAVVSGVTNTTNNTAVFVGSTSDLSQYIKKSQIPQIDV